MRQAWKHGSLEYEKVLVTLLPDMSRLTLAMRRAIKPLLEVILQAHATYRWGHPFDVITTKGSNQFILRSPSDLPQCFAFLEITPLDVTDWLSLSVPMFPTAASRPLPQRQRRARSRSHWRPRGRIQEVFNTRTPWSRGWAVVTDFGSPLFFFCLRLAWTPANLAATIWTTPLFLRLKD